MKVTPSSIYCDDEIEYGPYNSIQYDNQTLFHIKSEPNSWVCYELKNHQIVLTYYAIRSCRFGTHAPINFKIEIYNDQTNWEEIDIRNRVPFKVGNHETLTFYVHESQHKEAKFIRLIQTGSNSTGYNQIVLESIEFYGYLK